MTKPWHIQKKKKNKQNSPRTNPFTYFLSKKPLINGLFNINTLPPSLSLINNTAYLYTKWKLEKSDFKCEYKWLVAAWMWLIDIGQWLVATIIDLLD
jgi:hypothetical protein